MKKYKVAFVGQKLYFYLHYGPELEKLYNVRTFEMKYFAKDNYYNDLLNFNPDVIFLFRMEFIPDSVLKDLKGIKIALSSEPIPKHINGKLICSDDMLRRFEALKQAIGKYDYFFHYDESSLRYLQENGFPNARSFVFPVSTELCNPDNKKQDYDALFVGRSTEHREKMLEVLKRDYKILHIAHGIEWPESVNYINRAKINLNLHVEDELQFEPRLQILFACKSFVMSEPLSNKNVFLKDKHYIEVYTEKDFISKFEYYLQDEQARRSIAQEAYDLTISKYQSKQFYPKIIEEVINNEKSN